MIGTIRTLDKDMKELIRKRMQEMVPAIAQTYRAEATVTIQDGAGIVFNNEAHTEKMIPTLERVAGNENVMKLTRLRCKIFVLPE